MTEEKQERKPLHIRNLADYKRKIKPGTEIVATYHANHPGIVGLVREVTEVQTVCYYSVIKGQPDHKYSGCNLGRGFRSDFGKASEYVFGENSIKVLDKRSNDGSVLCEIQVFEPMMQMDEAEHTSEKQEENGPIFGGMGMM